MNRIDPYVVKAQVQLLLEQNPDLREDHDAFLMSLESETELIELLTQLVKRIGETEAYMEGTKDYIGKLRARMDDMDRWTTGWRRMIFQLMQSADAKSLMLPIGRRVVIQRGQQKVVVVDESRIPQEFKRWEPNLKEIKQALKQGTQVPGCTLSNAEPVLAIR
jgi:hypothetical protein